MNKDVCFRKRAQNTNILRWSDMFWAGWCENMKERASKYEYLASSTSPRAAIWGRFLQKEWSQENRHLYRKQKIYSKNHPEVSGSGRGASPTYQDLYLSHFGKKQKPTKKNDYKNLIKIPILFYLNFFLLVCHTFTPTQSSTCWWQYFLVMSLRHRDFCDRV